MCTKVDRFNTRDFTTLETKTGKSSFHGILQSLLEKPYMMSQSDMKIRGSICNQCNKSLPQNANSNRWIKLLINLPQIAEKITLR